MNNSFNENIAQICGLELATLIGSYKYSVFGSNTFVVEGHNGIVAYSNEEVSFAVCDGVLRVYGCSLHIKCLSKNFAVITGKIRGVEVTDREK